MVIVALEVRLIMIACSRSMLIDCRLLIMLTDCYLGMGNAIVVSESVYC